MIVAAAHQPDLLPYSGFWHKMAKADVFDLRIHDQFLKRGYQKRVLMRGEWANVIVPSVPRSTPIFDVRIDPVEAPRLLGQMIRGRYGGSAYFDSRGKYLLERIEDIHTNRLWQFNLELILIVRELLGITTPIGLAPAPEGPKNVGIVGNLQRYGADVYLSGPGAREYMGDCQEFTDAGMQVLWSRHEPPTPDSILTVLMDCDEPMDAVLAEQSE